MVMKVYGHIPDEDRKKNVKMSEQVFYKKENLNSDQLAGGEKEDRIAWGIGCRGTDEGGE